MQPDQARLNELSTDQIARIAGVQPSAVSNWAHREHDFPQPVREDGRRTIYERAAVMSWLNTNRPELLGRQEDLANSLWTMANDLRGVADFESLIELLAWATVVARDETATVSDAHALSRAVEQRSGHDELTALIDRLNPDQSHRLSELAERLAVEDGRPLDELVTRLARSPKRPAYAASLLDEFIDAADLRPGQSVLDTTPGFSALTRRISERFPAVRLTALSSLDRQSRVADALDAVRRLDVNRVSIDQLASLEVTFDRVLGTDPLPLRDRPLERKITLAESELGLRWDDLLERYLATVAEDGRALIAAAPNVLSSMSAAQSRQSLVRSGQLIAVIRLDRPTSGLARTDDALLICKPRPIEGGREHILMVDLANRALESESRDWKRWSEGTSAPNDQRARPVSLAELEEHDFVLSPDRYVQSTEPQLSARELSEQLVAIRSRFATALDAAHEGIARFHAPRFDIEPSRWRETSLEELANERVLHLAVGRANATRGEATQGGVPIYSMRYLSTGQRADDEYVDPEDLGREGVVRSGDLVIRLDHKPGRHRRVTDVEDGWALGRGLARVRPDRHGAAADLDWIAFCVATSDFQREVQRRAPGSGLQRLSTRDLGRIPVPMPPLEVQRATVDHYAWIEAAGEILANLQTSGDEFLELARKTLEAHLAGQRIPPLESRPHGDPEQRSTDMPELIIESFGEPGQFSVFRLQRAGCDATGLPTASGFMVRAGSLARLDATKSMPESKLALRRELQSDGVLVPRGKHLAFHHDYEFNSSSAAATVVTGTSSNGRNLWTTDGGLKLGDWEDRQ